MTAFLANVPLVIFVILVACVWLYVKYVRR